MFGKLVRGILQTIGLLTVLAAIGAVGAFLFLAPWLQYQDQPEPARYILPLAGDEHRLIKAAELYNQGLAPKVLLSNERVRPPSRADLLRLELGYPRIDGETYRLALLERLGVPRTATESFGHGLVSTVEEAEALQKFLPQATGTIILVTSPYQARRAKLIFEGLMPGTRFLIVWPPEGAVPARWWTDRDAALLAVSEMAKLVFYRAGGAFRSTAAQVPRTSAELAKAIVQRAKADGSVDLNWFGDKTCFVYEGGYAPYYVGEWFPGYDINDDQWRDRSNGVWHIVVSNDNEHTVRIFSIDQRILRWDIPAGTKIADAVGCKSTARVMISGTSAEIIVFDFPVHQ
jgi:uncharacterized SAM-binding protein YcdF (DUF218 family)